MIEKKIVLSSQVTKALRNRIVQWEYPPNHPLNEEMLCQDFGVSRSPIREALKTLEAEGLVQRLKNRSYVVRQIRIVDIEELYDFRLALELYSLETLTQTPKLHDQVRAMREYWDLLELKEGDSHGLAMADQKLHEDLLTLVGNATFLTEIKKLNERFFIFRVLDFDQPERIDITRAQHLDILDAVLEGNVEKARARLSKNILAGRNNVSQKFAKIVASSYENARAN